MHGWYHNCFACIPLMSRHHRQEPNHQSLNIMTVVTIMYFIMVQCVHTIGYMCKSTLCHSRTLISAIPATHTNICDFLDKCISTFQLRFKLLLCHLIFPHCINSLQRLQHNNKYLHFYCIIMLIRRSFNSPLAACNVRGTQKGSCEALQRAD